MKKHPSTEGVNLAVLKRGIKNQCQVKINDTRKQYSVSAYQGQSFYLDFCSGQEPAISYFNKGRKKGSCKEYEDRDGCHTTLLGAFLTSNDEFAYTNFGKNKKKYNAAKKLIGRGIVPSVALFGLQNTNNDSCDVKYMHVSPLQSSWGCPSIPPADEKKYKIIETMAKRGPSLVVNYGDKMEDPSECSH